MLSTQCLCLLSLTALVAVSALPQRASSSGGNRRVDQIALDEVLTINQNRTRDSSRSPAGQVARGFARIVTPTPLGDNDALIDFQSVSGRSECNCVPYHMCTPSSGTTNNDVGDANADGGFDGFGLIDLRFNSNDPVCEHFLDVCCASNRTSTKSLTPTPQDQRPNRSTGCGIRNLGGIDFNLTGANDNEAGFGEFPWTVALLHASNSTYFCAGSLIHPSVILTAVHCLYNHTVNSFIVRAGEWDTQTTKERLPYEQRRVRTIIQHPNFNNRNVANDFALVILQQPFTLGDHINTICLPNQETVPVARTVCYSTGWGKDVFGAAGRFSAIMKRIPQPIVDFRTCQQQLRRTRLGERFVLDRTFVCAGGERGIDTCQGDGGAPFVCSRGFPDQERYEQVGIVAWGIGCNDEIPAVYANVGIARSWIDEQMLANGFSTSTYSAVGN